MKKALLITPPFFNYEDYIKQELEIRGYHVFYINHKRGKLVEVLYSFLSFEKQRRLYSNVLMNRLAALSKEEIDLLLVVRGDFLTKDHIQYLKRLNPQLKSVMYQWDSVCNFDYIDLIPYFDKVVTFDIQDSKVLELDYLPLFYTNDIRNTPIVQEDIDFLLIGTFNPLRYQYYLRLRKLARKYHLKLYAYIFTPFSFFIKNLIINKQSHVKTLTGLRFSSMKRSTLLRYYSRAKVIVDVCVANQTGLSMRIIESYGLNKKVLTSNINIGSDPILKEIDYINIDESEDNIVEFVNRPVKEYLNKKKLSISCWLDALLDMSK